MLLRGILGLLSLLLALALSCADARRLEATQLDSPTRDTTMLTEELRYVARRIERLGIVHTDYFSPVQIQELVADDHALAHAHFVETSNARHLMGPFSIPQGGFGSQYVVAVIPRDSTFATRIAPRLMTNLNGYLVAAFHPGQRPIYKGILWLAGDVFLDHMHHWARHSIDDIPVVNPIMHL